MKRTDSSAMYLSKRHAIDSTRLHPGSSFVFRQYSLFPLYLLSRSPGKKDQPTDHRFGFLSRGLLRSSPRRSRHSKHTPRLPQPFLTFDAMYALSDIGGVLL